MAKSRFEKIENLNAFIKNNEYFIMSLLKPILGLAPHIEHELKDSYGIAGDKFIIRDKRPNKFGVLGMFTACYEKLDDEFSLAIENCKIPIFKEFSIDIKYKLLVYFSHELNDIRWELQFYKDKATVYNSIQFIFNGKCITGNCTFDRNSKNMEKTEESYVSSRTLLDHDFLKNINGFVSLFFEKPELFKIYSVSDIIDALPNKDAIKGMELVLEMIDI
jgi:hypothetical protein